MVKLLNVMPHAGYKLHLEYDDGTVGDVDVSELIGKGVFQALGDIAVFETVTVGEHGEVRWTDDLELCPDSLYLQMTGKSAEDLFPNPRAHADVQEGESVKFRHHNAEEANDIVQLFTSVFATSEGDAEGALIGKLAADLFETTDNRDLFNYVAVDADHLVASIFVTRLDFDNNCDAFILGPVAVNSDRQRKGIGQTLIRHGLNDLKDRGVEFVLTYGDPTFYRKVDFQQISPATIRAPFKLSQPEGWLGQSLGETSIEKLSGACTSVTAFNDPVFW